jgi:hypothetical protein
MMFSNQNRLSPISFTEMISFNGTRPSALCTSNQLATAPSTSPETTSKSRRTIVDAAFALDELIERFGIGFVFQRVPHGAGPLGSGPFVHLGRIGRAADHAGERLVAL